MEFTKNGKKFMVMGIIFGILTIIFTLLYHFNIIKTFDTYLCATYVVYFVGLALLYNGAYCKEKSSVKSQHLNYVIAAIFIILAIVMLIYGFSTGMVSFIN
ncbi:MAG: hypothetical protein J6K39_03505 [Clostridia bacterium]|nr:hypothetical protein [Clostridia bacterium]